MKKPITYLLSLALCMHGAIAQTLKPAAKTDGSNIEPGPFKTALALSKSDVGLGNVTNTSDANKPVSTATQTALDGKVGNTSIIAGAYGGTGIANTGKTITLGGNFATTGSYNLTLALSGNVTVTIPSTSYTAARTDAGQTFAGANSFSGQVQLTGQSATDANSAMTRGLADTRYGEPYNLFLTADISSSSTTFVDGSETITLPAGTYEMELSLYGTTASATGGIECNIKMSANNDSDTVGQIIKSANISVTGGNVTPSTTIRTGSSVLNLLINATSDAPNKACCTLTKAMFTLSGSTTFTPQVKQRSATDGANSAKLLKKSSIKFIKR